MNFQDEIKRIMDLSFRAGTIFGFLCGVSATCGVVALAIQFLK